jgi:hypothetical protein
VGYGLQWIKKKSTTGIMGDTVAVMAELRVSIENHFTESHLLFNHLSNTAQMKLGSMPVSLRHAHECAPCAMVVSQILEKLGCYSLPCFQEYLSA